VHRKNVSAIELHGFNLHNVSAIELHGFNLHNVSAIELHVYYFELRSTKVLLGILHKLSANESACFRF